MDYQKAIMIIACLGLAACRQVSEKDLKSYALNCPVREIQVKASMGELDYHVWFNRSCRVDSIYFSLDGTHRYKEINKYDKSLRLVDVADIDNTDFTEGRYEYEYDGELMREARFYGANNDLLQHWIHENDGERIIRTSFLNEGEPTYISERVYDGLSYDETVTFTDGNVLRSRVVLFDADKPCRIISDNMDVTIDYSEDGLPVHTVNTLINSRNELVWVSDLEEHPERFYSYEYDDKGNWILRKEYNSLDGEVLATVTRSLLY
ncbi:MAG: hypothetical protein MJZ07_05045 [Bacteroidales bacterium]|nr:hypothetical protein [Bacteroidales bacterium]